MGDGYGGRGVARAYGFIFGPAYLAVALVELLTMRGGLSIGGFEALSFGGLHNVIHWATGLAVLGSAIAGEGPARTVARVVGIVFLLVTIWNIVAPDAYASFVGIEGDLPITYTIVHAATAAGALFAGFASYKGEAARA